MKTVNNFKDLNALSNKLRNKLVISQVAYVEKMGIKKDIVSFVKPKEKEYASETNGWDCIYVCLGKKLFDKCLIKGYPELESFINNHPEATVFYVGLDEYEITNFTEENQSFTFQY